MPQCIVPQQPPATDSVHATWSLPPISPPRNPPPPASTDSPYTPPRQPINLQEQACSNMQKNEVEDNAFKVHAVQEILKEEKILQD